MSSPEQRKKNRDYQREWRKRNPAKVVESNATSRATKARRRKQYPRMDKSAHLKYEFGITLEQYDVMLAQQKGVCAVCKTSPGKTALAVDHCHESGLIRGLLCAACNVALGMLRECPNRMDALKDYINAFRWLK